ncbi:MAG: hypothetical protein H7A45_11090 [Verrucomicrobiales bacterium]|nr:hypothetical protein [Verrucomicrobiales bacterium]MCP5526877.1 hypothetical protein [Verrucomicrobiales bacterium]
MKRSVAHHLLGLLLLALPSACAATIDDSNVVWDSPSADHHGSMPLGNGDITLNAWATADGAVQFYIGKTDAWSDNARLLKVGKVEVRLEPNPFASGMSYRQELNLREGAIDITTEENVAGSQAPSKRATKIRAWVDANHPVIHVTAESATPVTATAAFVLWRTNRHELAELQVSDVLLNRSKPDQMEAPTFVEPDTILTGMPDRIGWYHHNTKSVGPALMARMQGLTGFSQPDPLLHRTFGAVITAEQGQRVDDQHLCSPRGTTHKFSIFVLTRHPATPREWTDAMDATIRKVESLSFAERRAAHESWWAEFWDRSWIRATSAEIGSAGVAALVPANSHPVRLGVDQAGGNRLQGDLGRVSVFDTALTDEAVQALSLQDPTQPLPGGVGRLWSSLPSAPDERVRAVAGSAGWRFTRGLTIEAWVRPDPLPGGGARLVDKITPGGSDGFLLDTFPGNSLRLICGDRILQQADAVPARKWTHIAAVVDPASDGCRLYVNGQQVAANTGVTIADEAAHVSQMYRLQRFITACAGRGAYPIKFNGSLFTVPPGPTEEDPDYRRWGPGYWWQNTRLPYISLCASGDFDLQRPLFRMYADELLPLCRYRTRHYFGHGGAYYPECIMFWGPVFSESYGWTPFEQRADKLQDSGYHKWEWVCGPELAWMMLDYYEHTQDRAFLEATALPFARETLAFFEEHHATNDAGKLVLHPAQAVETWWRCTNAMPELAGCRAVTERLLALPQDIGSPADRSFWTRLYAKLPELPLRDVNGQQALAPAAFYADKRNIENPELYAVFPFRLVAFNRPNAEWGLNALDHRWDRGDSGWRQDSVFMAYLGRAD